MKLFLKIVVIIVICQALTQDVLGQSLQNSKHQSTVNQSILKYTNFRENVLYVGRKKLFKNLLNMARRILQLETLALFTDSKQSSRNFQNFVSLKQDKVIITQPLEWQLCESFNGHVLSIIFLNSSNLNRELLDIFKRALLQWHYKKVLFITETPFKQSSFEWFDLFEWLHEQGFWNSLLIDNRGKTLAMDHFTLEFLNNTLSIENFFSLSIDWPDLKGYPIRVFLANDPPRSLIYTDKNDKLVFGGVLGWITNIFADVYNATLLIEHTFDMDRVLDCLTHLKEKTADLCGNGLALTPNAPYALTNLMQVFPSNLIVPYGKPLPRFYYFFKPFQWSLWCLMLMTFLYIILALSLIHRLQKGTWSLSIQLQYAVLSLANLPLQLKCVRGPLRSYLELVLIFKGFIISNWYLSLLTSLLYSHLYSESIDSLEDIERQNISIMVNAFEYGMLNASDLDPIIVQQLMIVSDEELLKHRPDLDTDYAYYSQIDKNHYYLYQQKFLLRPRMKELKEVPINFVTGGMPMRLNWPFEHLMNNIFRGLRDSGLFQRLMFESPEDGIRAGYLKYFPTEFNYVDPLNLEYFRLLGFILAGGYLLGFVSFLLEILCFKIMEIK